MKLAATAMAFFLSLDAMSGAGAVSLQGVVRHNEWQQPAHWQVGVAASGQRTNIWYRVPKWLAGTWQRSEDMQIFDLDCAEGTVNSKPKKIRVSSQFRYGLLRDKNGDIWQCASVPLTASLLKVESDKSIYEETGAFVENVNESFVTIASGGRELRCDSQGFKSCSWQQQTVSILTPLPGNQVLMNGSIRCYDNSGNLLSIDSNQTVISRALPFQETEVYNGEDLRSSFEQFLRDNGRDDLIPAKRIANLQSDCGNSN